MYFVIIPQQDCFFDEHFYVTANKYMAWLLVESFANMHFKKSITPMAIGVARKSKCLVAFYKQINIFQSAFWGRY